MLFVRVFQFAILYEVWHERCGIRGKAKAEIFNFVRRWGQKRAKTRNCGLGATTSPVTCLRETVICDMSWEKGSDFVEGANFRETFMPKIFVSIIRIRVADPLKISKFVNDKLLGFEFILSLTVRIIIVSDMTEFSLIKFVLG
jgi:hypothetical protein